MCVVAIETTQKPHCRSLSYMYNLARNALVTYFLLIIAKIYQNGLRELDITYILHKLIVPVTICLLLMITAPYVAANLVIPLLGKSWGVN